MTWWKMFLTADLDLATDDFFYFVGLCNEHENNCLYSLVGASGIKLRASNMSVTKK